MPSWRVHRRLLSHALRAVSADELKALGGEFMRGVFIGVVEPDEVPDKVTKLTVSVSRRGYTKVRTRKSYVRHHTADTALIEYYYNLALYYARRGRNRLAGVALGRAIHYAQDSAVRTKKYLIFNVHDDVEKVMDSVLLATGGSLHSLCRNVDKESSADAVEALCIAFKKTLAILTSFFRELSTPVDVEKLRKRVLKIRIAKACVALAGFATAVILQSWLVYGLSLIVAIALALYKPRTYIEAMKAGLMVVKPTDLLPALKGEAFTCICI